MNIKQPYRRARKRVNRGRYRRVGGGWSRGGWWSNETLPSGLFSVFDTTTLNCRRRNLRPGRKQRKEWLVRQWATHTTLSLEPKSSLPGSGGEPEGRGADSGGRGGGRWGWEKVEHGGKLEVAQAIADGRIGTTIETLHSPLDGEQRLFLACTLQEWPLGFGTWMEARLKLISPVVDVALR